MRTNRVITVTQIEKRQRAQSSTNEGTDSIYLYNISLNSIKRHSPLLESNSAAFFKGCENRKNANKYYSKCLSLIEDVRDNDRLVHVLENMMANEIVPYIDNLDSFKDSITRHSNLPTSTMNTLTEAVKVNKICQRILNNNASISNRFNLDKYIKENTHRPLEETVLKCCTMIDTYKTPGYAKMNIALEELSYIYQKNAVNYDKSKMIQLVTEYFLNRTQHTNKNDMALYKNVLLDNCCISDDDLSNVMYFINEDFTEDNTETDKQPNPYDTPATNTDDTITDDKAPNEEVIVIRKNPVLDAFNLYKLSEDKTPDTFDAFMAHIMSYKLSDILKVLPSILDWFRNYAISNLIGVSGAIEFISNLIEKATHLEQINVATAKLFADIIRDEANKASVVSSDDELSAEEFTMYTKYNNTLQAAADTISQYIIDIESIENTDKINKIQENGSVMSLDEFKIFKFQNLITSASKVDKALARTNNKLIKKLKDKASKIFSSVKDWLNEGYTRADIEGTDIIDCISEAGYFDHILGVYKVNDISDTYETHQLFKEFCDYMNNEFGINSSVRVYYESIDNLIELHICDSTYITLTEEQMEEWDKVFTETEQFYAGYLMSIAEGVEALSNINTKTFVSEFAEVEDSLTAANIVSIIELSTMLGGMVSYNRLNEIADNYRLNNPIDYGGNNAIKHALEDWKLSNVDIDIQAEAVMLLHEAIETTLLEDNPNKLPNNVKPNNNATKKDDNKKDDKKSTIKDKVNSANQKIKDNAEEKVEKTKINFNTLRYAMEGLKTKAKSLGDKATKASHELDIYVEKFVKSIKALYTNDNRESIIKGSVIPTFHQLMGRLMVIAGTGGAGGIIGAVTGIGGPAGAVFAAAVTTFATIAISKHTTDQQRRLMLDELEIEIQVCDRELSKADSNGQVKKARAILTRKRKLQREMSRIKYHIGDSAMITSAEAIPDKD